MVRSPVVRAIRIRKPWGKGKAALQKRCRQSKASEIASLLLDRLDGESIQMTGEMFPRGTLKSRRNKSAFSWVSGYTGRVFTKPLLKLVVRKVYRGIGPIPTNPKLSYGAYVNQQALRLGQLVRQAKRLKQVRE